jgi:hypothetical protein
MTAGAFGQVVGKEQRVKRILIIDDDPFVREVCEMCFASAGG